MSIPEEPRTTKVTRRQILSRMGMIGAGALLTEATAAWAAGPAWARVIERAAQVKPHGSDLGAIEHFVFLMLENRSYDHYFGAYPRGRGFSDHPKDSLGVFAQDFPGGAHVSPKHKLLPFHLDSRRGYECTDDLTHDWGPMHKCWNHGKMDSWVKVHTAPQYEAEQGALTMGYYTRADLPFHWALADHFTLCDAYHCSILGPTHPNRLMAISGTIDPAGKQGGPVVQTNDADDSMWNCTWTTMPELLQDKGVSWKVYTPSNENVTGQYAALANYGTWTPTFYNPATNAGLLGVTDHVLPYFTAFRDPASPLYDLAFNQTFPNQFVADIAAGQLPSVSWIVPPLGFDEHPAASAMNGQFFTSLVLGALVANPEVWSKTAFLIMYDENDGWFDHVPPPVAPPGTPGEHLTSKLPPQENNPFPDTLGFKGPLGLGIRVPALMVSPFSRGGHIATEVFDHTSQLKLIAARFGVEVPNVSAWRRKTVGDLTSALTATGANASVPALPATSVLLPQSGTCAYYVQETDANTGAAGPHYPNQQRMPNQHGSSEPAAKYFELTAEEKAIPADSHTEIPSLGHSTTKSAHNKLVTIA